MKLPVLVAQYFYQHRQLNLPGIGSFFLDEAVTIPDVADKNFRDFLQYIQFKQNNTVTRPDEALIEFIRSQTGKIRPLAESDLESYIADGKLLLNIGKPFHIEGIGSLHKNKEGIFEFTPGEPILQKLEAIAQEKEPAEKPARKKSVFDEDYYPHEAAGSNTMRRLIIGLVIIIGLAVIVWGGYTLYNKKVQPAETTTTTEEQPAVDSAALRQADSLARAKALADSLEAAGKLPHDYKYVLETTTRKSTALKRYRDLYPKINVETKDSSLFKIVIVIPSLPADTTRLKDSLHFWYWGDRKRKIYIEH